MRIISDFHDYYDGVQAMDSDRSLIYRRKTVEIEQPKMAFGERMLLPFDDAFARDNRLEFDYVTVGFCGKIWPLLRLKCWRNGVVGADRHNCYSIEDVDQLVDRTFDQEGRASYRDPKRRLGYRLTGGRRDIERFFSIYEEWNQELVNLFDDHGVPAFCYWHTLHKPKLILNPQLRSLEFFRVVATQTAYQSLVMWLGAQAEPRRPIPVLDDVTMAEIKGHGGRYSFRKPPAEPVAR